jgi:glycine hydroxymethyltransferase
MNGLRIGTPELVRWGMKEHDMPRLAELLQAALTTNDPQGLAQEVADWRTKFDTMHYIHGR